MGVAEVESMAAHTGQLAGCRGAEGHVVERAGHTDPGQQLVGPGAPQRHFRVSEVPCRRADSNTIKKHFPSLILEVIMNLYVTGYVNAM